MSYHIYTTKGVVLSLRPQRETDKVVYVFTQDLGLIVASARGVRTMRSKLSQSLTELSFVRLSLVKGKRSWRVTSVALIENFGLRLKESRLKVELMSRVLRLIAVLVRGEEKNVELYDELEWGVKELFDSVEEADLEVFEINLVSKILSHLGYMSKEDLPKTLQEIRGKKKHYLSLVNAGIESSGLK